MATIQQKQAVKKLSEAIGNKQPIKMGKIMLESGYSISTSKTPQRLTETKGFKQLLSEIDDEPLLKRVKEIAMDTDKRASLEAIKLLLIELKGLGADKKVKIGRMMDDINDLFR